MNEPLTIRKFADLLSTTELYAHELPFRKGLFQFSEVFLSYFLKVPLSKNHNFFFLLIDSFVN